MIIWPAAKYALFVFGLPIPIAFAATQGLIYGVGPERWGAVAIALFTAFRTVGLTGELYIFSWEWTTLFLGLIGVPYTFVVMVCHDLYGRFIEPNHTARRHPLLLTFLFCLPSAFLAVLLMHRLLAWLVPVERLVPATSWLDGSYPSQFVIFALPLALLSIAACELATRIRRQSPQRTLPVP